jgi:hypothetical protein
MGGERWGMGVESGDEEGGCGGGGREMEELIHGSMIVHGPPFVVWDKGFFC